MAEKEKLEETKTPSECSFILSTKSRKPHIAKYANVRFPSCTIPISCLKCSGWCFTFSERWLAYRYHGNGSDSVTEFKVSWGYHFNIIIIYIINSFFQPLAVLNPACRPLIGWWVICLESMVADFGVFLLLFPDSKLCLLLDHKKWRRTFIIVYF